MEVNTSKMNDVRRVPASIGIFINVQVHDGKHLGEGHFSNLNFLNETFNSVFFRHNYSSLEDMPQLIIFWIIQYEAMVLEIV